MSPASSSSVQPASGHGPPPALLTGPETLGHRLAAQWEVPVTVACAPKACRVPTPRTPEVTTSERGSSQTQLVG